MLRFGPRRPRRVARALSAVLIVIGVLVLVDAGLTLAWQEPVSAVVGLVNQDRLSGDLKRLESARPTRAERRRLARLHRQRKRMAFLARRLHDHVKWGQAIGRIEIPEVGASYVVVQGDDAGALRRGPGHYPGTTMPGLRGTVAIAGHRTTYLAPFRHIDSLQRGDEVRLKMPYGMFVYRVQEQRVVKPTALWVARRTKHDRLVLSSCEPLYSAAKRLVVIARLQSSTPRGSALRVSPTT